MKQWHCAVCGHIHTGDEPPNRCPVCGTTGDDFTEQTPQKQIPN